MTAGQERSETRTVISFIINKCVKKSTFAKNYMIINTIPMNKNTRYR